MTHNELTEFLMHFTTINFVEKDKRDGLEYYRVDINLHRTWRPALDWSPGHIEEERRRFASQFASELLKGISYKNTDDKQEQPA